MGEQVTQWPHPGLVFVVMKMDSRMDEVYAAIKDECRAFGMDPVRADDFLGAANIFEEVLKNIGDAEFIVCDLTHASPNVYYELGYAHGIGNRPLDIFLIARAKTRVHFNASSFLVRRYKDIDELRAILRGPFKRQVDKRRQIEQTE